jgi:hypothetical protein
MEELETQLETYCVQLDQVQEALKLSSSNRQLLDLQQQLQELVKYFV